MGEEEIGTLVINKALKVHSALGAGLLESVYEACLAYELVRQGLQLKQQFPCPIVYEDVKIDGAFRLDLLIEDKVVVEVKAVEKILPVHGAQLLSYLKLGKYKLGFLLNFNVVRMKDGIQRVVNNL